MMKRLKFPIIQILFILPLLGIYCTRTIVYNGEYIPSILSLKSEDFGRITIFDLKKRYWPEDPPTQRFDSTSEMAMPPISGLDALTVDRFSLLRNRKFALLTNATGLDLHLNRGLELMLNAGIRPDLIFEPEHGLYGHLDQKSLNGIRTDPETGMRILSLYSNLKKPECRHLEGIDLIVIDIENLPVRCYTYISTLTYLLEIAEKNRIEIMILDRAIPYGFWKPQGPYLEERYKNFVAEAPVPFLYNLTVGEYARFMADAKFHRLRLSIVRAANFDRSHKFSAIRRLWINPSPNIPSFESSLVYPGVVLFEGTNVSLGRGTTRPFVYSGTPYMDSKAVVERLRKKNLPGVSFAEIIFTPNSSLHNDQICHGIQLFPLSDEFDPIRTGYEYMRTVRNLHPDRFEFLTHRGRYRIDDLWGGDSYRLAIESDLPYDQFQATWIDDSKSFQKLAKKYMMY